MVKTESSLCNVLATWLVPFCHLPQDTFCHFHFKYKAKVKLKHIVCFSSYWFFSFWFFLHFSCLPLCFAPLLFDLLHLWLIVRLSSIFFCLFIKLCVCLLVCFLVSFFAFGRFVCLFVCLFVCWFVCFNGRFFEAVLWIAWQYVLQPK